MTRNTEKERSETHTEIINYEMMLQDVKAYAESRDKEIFQLKSTLDIITNELYHLKDKYRALKIKFKRKETGKVVENLLEIVENYNC